MFTPAVYFKSINKLNGGKALDLGCGEGGLTLRLLENGYEVDAVDIKSQIITGVNFIQSDIRNFEIKENYYDLIASRNVLPFLANRKEVEDMVAKMFGGLKEGGIMYFTLFGTRDFRVETRPETVFIDDFLSPGKLIYKSEEFYLGRTKTGQLRNWHCYSFVVGK